MAKGYCFNNPIEIVDNAISLDTIAKFDSKNIVIETIKVAEDNNGIIVRAYECLGQNAKSTLNLNFNATDIYECDMLENKEKLARGKSFEFAPFEIKTLYLGFEK